MLLAIKACSGRVLSRFRVQVLSGLILITLLLLYTLSPTVSRRLTITGARLNGVNSGAILAGIGRPDKPAYFEYFPVTRLQTLPRGKEQSIARLQADDIFEGLRASETHEQRRIRNGRLSEVRSAFLHAWNGYRLHAWGHDELRPLAGGSRDKLNGWGATLFDSLDTLWIMGCTSEFEEAVERVSKVNFAQSITDRIPLFETNIRYLGGLISAYDVSQGKYPVLLAKAQELGELLLRAFDTPNRMPMLYFDWSEQSASSPRLASNNAILAELGSLSLEFTRLTQLTGDDRFYDAVARITDNLYNIQNQTSLPGLWPKFLDVSGCSIDESLTKRSVVGFEDKISSLNWFPVNKLMNGLTGMTINEDEVKVQISGEAINKEEMMKTHFPQCRLKGIDFYRASEEYTIGSMTDSAYEYLPKVYMLLNGQVDKYREMTERAFDAAQNKLIFKPMTPHNQSILVAGTYTIFETDGGKTQSTRLNAQGSHLGCYSGAMYALAGKMFGREDYLRTGKGITDACAWNYESMPTGIMAEQFTMIACESEECPWNEVLWQQSINKEGWSDESVSSGLMIYSNDDDVNERPIRRKRDILKMPRGYSSIIDRRYLLRPETLESVFYLYRLTGNTTYQDMGWKIFRSIDRHTRTGIGYSSISDVTSIPASQLDEMESFWTAETLKYLYLLFSDPNVISLDEWIFNTEAHPFRRPERTRK